MSEDVTCQVKRVLTGAHVEITLHQWWKKWQCTPEEHARRLQKAVSEFQEFLRDHRSQDVNSMDVVAEYQDQCSSCGREWDSYTDDDASVHCCYCGARVVVETAQEKK